MFFKAISFNTFKKMFGTYDVVPFFQSNAMYFILPITDQFRNQKMHFTITFRTA